MLVWFLLIVVFFGAARSLDLEGDFEVTVPKLSLVHDRKARSTSGVSAQQEDVLIYTLTAFGESVRLHLRRSHDFIATSLVVEYHKREGKRMMEPGNNYALRRCFYSGFAAGHNGRMDATPAAFSVCGGLSGAYTTTRGQFFVEPLSEKINGSSGGGRDSGEDVVDRPHVVYKRKPVNSSYSSQCGLSGQLSQDVPKLSETLKRRRRSQSMENYIETLVVADQEMYKFHKKKTEHYLLVVSSVVAHLFQDPSLQNFVRVVVVRMIILEENPITLDASGSAGYYLSSFCRWQAAVNFDSHHELHHDTALLFTRNNICKTPTRCDTLGLAELGTICDSTKSCAINEDNGLSVALTAAHELGHILNIPHDGAAVDCHLKPNEYRLMAPTLSSHTKPWSWSQCSSRALTEFLDGGNGICLLDRPGKAKKELTEELPGQLFDLDQQCEFAFGPDVQSCKYIQDEIPCKRLWCGSTNALGCRTRHMPWAEGTPCGHNKWCSKGVCVAKETKDLPVDGGWGQWEPYSKCTRTCGGGVQFSERECNQPTPVNGGQYCVGQRRQHRSCNTQECPDGSIPFRELQCRSFDGRKHNFNDLPYDVNWSPKYNMRPSDVCKLFCYADSNGKYYRLAAKVIDGTPCRPDSLDICVDGQCRPAGCDHVLGSNARLDKCGQCGGDGRSCKPVTDSLQRAGHYGYNKIMTFPAGATSIQVHQPPLFRRDDNYLALQGNTGKYYLNGRFQISVGRTKYSAAGAVWYYNGSQTGLETLSASGPLKEAVTLMVLSVGTEKIFKLDWTFNSPIKRRTYHWVHSDWQDCSSDCQGYQEKRLECRAIGQVSSEADEICDSSSKPKPQSRQCNTHCSFEWVIARSHCSATCGPGKQNEIPTCVRRQPGTQVQVVPAEHCSLSQAPPSQTVLCQVKACVNDQAEWRKYKWSSCSVSCGGGVQYRKVRCVNFKLWQLLAEEECAAIPKPATEQKCSERPCTDYHWVEGNWDACSQTCDIGMQQRALTCSNQNGQRVHASYCSTLQRPATTQECIIQRCTQWKSDEWSQCSSSCGTGYQTRRVSCVDANGRVISTTKCNPFSKPDEQRVCRLSDCPRGQWRLSSWSACSASCGSGIRRKRVICIDGQGRELGNNDCNGSNKPNEEREACVVHANCYKWTVSEWSQCPKTCGGGKARRVVECQTLNGLKQDDSRCRHTRKPAEIELCNEDPCPTWKKLPWSRCSVTCGRGEKQRSVLCLGHDGKHLSEDHCKLKNKPRLVRPCEPIACPQWKLGAWSPCSKSCGKGVQTREVGCWRKKRRVEESKCSPSPPLSLRLCDIQNCSTSFSWDIGQWGPCSVTCGNGVTTRVVRCISNATKELVGIDQCEVSSQPRKSAVCVSRQTCPGHWTPGNWSKCSSTCGHGVQTRTVNCISGGQLVSPSYCSPQMPSRSQPCVQSPCDQVIWYYGDWMDCDRSCGGGIQRRQHYCGYQNSPQTRLRDQSCIEKHGSPASHQRCSLLPCSSGVHWPSSCQQVKLQKLGTTDGTYSILTGSGGVLQIYCHAMGTADPKEFITLSPHAHNFAEIYHLALRDPSTCPTVLNSSVINRHHYPSKGRTVFGRVRIDVQSMELIANDYTFARTRNSSTGRSIEYGSAGDCFSKSGCPKGRFQVDLRHTGLKVDPRNRWHRHGSPGSNTTMIIDFDHGGQVVEGKCGGHCGRCYSEASKIKVQIV